VQPTRLPSSLGSALWTSLDISVLARVSLAVDRIGVGRCRGSPERMTQRLHLDSLDIVAAKSVGALLCTDAVFTLDFYGPLRPHPG